MSKNKVIIELTGFQYSERMAHTDGYVYERLHGMDDTLGGCTEWYNEGCVGISEDLVSHELHDELETLYQTSKQGFEHLYLKKRKNN